MTDGVFSLHNFLSWAAQVALIISIGVLLPKILRIRHPRSHLAYCYWLLVASLMLPFIQPWQHPVVSINNAPYAGPSAGAAAAGAMLPDTTGSFWSRVVFAILLTGVVLKLCRFAAGLWRLRQYSLTSMPLEGALDSVASARRLTGQDANVRISAHGVGPVTFGLFRPVILLPDSFLDLDEQAQRAIVIHELLHVKRRDWLAAIIEELVGALLWFHPGIWWVLGQIKLSREQLVDAEVVRRSAGCEHYVHALLTMAGAQPACELTAAAPFLRRRHLIQRMRLLLIERPISSLRLVGSYASIVFILSITAFAAFITFPLLGAPSSIPTPTSNSRNQTSFVKRATSRDEVYKVGNGVSAPTVLATVEPQYSDTARGERIRGTVMLEGVVETDGSMTVLGVARSLHPELDHNAVRALEQWRFEPGKLNGVPVRVQLNIEVSFNFL